MKRLRRILISLFIICLWATLASCAQSGAGEEPTEKTARVMLAADEGILVFDDIMIEVPIGSNAVFRIAVQDGYTYAGASDGAIYSEADGTLSIENVRFPCIVNVSAEEIKPLGKRVSLTVHTDEARGSVSYLQGGAVMHQGDAIIAPTAAEGYVFGGWSTGNYLDLEGELVSMDSPYRLRVDRDTTLYANFFTGLYTIRYHANGGIVAATGADTLYYRDHYRDLFPSQQTLHSNGTFVREGYVAVGYSTSPVAYESYADVNRIPGFSNLGGICQVEDGLLDLYVVWAKQTDPSTFTVSNGRITRYTGPGGIVVIPERINGVAITAIAPDVFTADITRVVIPRTVTEVADGAFNGCKNLHEVVFFDSVATISDNSFKNCPDITTVVLNSQRLPRYSGKYEGTFCIKYERVRTLQGKKIVVVSGSSSFEGLISETFEKQFPGYSVVNFGTIAAYSMVFQLDVISNYIHEGDIVIYAPEFTMGQSMGDARFEPKTFRGFEQCYDIFREIDMRNYTGFFSGFSEFQKGGIVASALQMEPHAYQLAGGNVNLWGDYTIPRPGPTAASFGSSTKFNHSILNDTRVRNLTRVSDRITARGGVMVMSFSPYDSSSLDEASRNQAAYDAFTAYCAGRVPFPVISNVGTCIFEHALFYDTAWHCSDRGAMLRTERLAADLRSFLEKRT